MSKIKKEEDIEKEPIWLCIREKREEIRLLDNMLKDMEGYFFKLEDEY